MEKRQELVVQDYQLEQISIFTQKGLALKAAAEQMKVDVATDLPSAQAMKKQAQQLMADIENEKKAITFPFRDFVKKLNTLADECSVPTEQARLIIDQKLLAFDERVETERRARAEEERKRLEEARLKEEADRKVREAEELRLRKIEQDKIQAIHDAQEAEKIKIAEERDANIRAQRELEAQKLEQERKLEEQRIAIAQKERAMAEKQKEFEIAKAEMDKAAAEAGDAERKAQEEAQNKVKGVRSSWTYDIVNEPLVGRELCTPDSKKINAAIKGGLREAPGLRIYEAKRVQ